MTCEASSVTALIGMGANLDDPVQQIVDARQRLLNWPRTQHARCSSMYLSTPVGYAEQADFINCVLALQTSASAFALLDLMQSIELVLGRVRDKDNQNAPRRIDLDLLYFGDQLIRDARLEVPHPRIAERLFVLKPLAELGINVAADPNTDFSQQSIHQLVC